MADFDEPPPTKIASDSQAAFKSLQTKELAVLCGQNNSGKSFTLRQTLQKLGKKASYLGPARYNNFTHLGVYSPQPNRKTKEWRQLLRQIKNDKKNIDNSPLNLSRSIAEMSDTRRGKLFDLIDNLLGTNTQVRPTVDNNSMSQKYVDVDGYNLSYTSSGYRLVATLLTVLLDKHYKKILIDEPELGLSPEIQGAVADFLYNSKYRSKHFPHIDSIILATHSPIFLDRDNVKNNFFVEKDGAEIRINQLETVQELNSLQFFLLGNRFETLFLPSAIILVEGKTDYEYINRLVNIKYPDSLVSVIQCNSDSRVKEVLHIAEQMLTDIQRSPYADRIFAVLDSVHGDGLTDQLEQMGLPNQNIIIWDSNGIEHIYPPDILKQKFGSYEELKIEGDVVSSNGINVKKAELASYVTTRLTENVDLPEEMQEKLLNRLDSVLY